MGAFLVTGAAGFIASKVAEFLLADGHQVVGVDNINDAYDTRLKYWRLDRINPHPNFTFHHLDITDRPAMEMVFKRQSPAFSAVINLAARAGVRASVVNPWVYIETNTTGTLNLLELCRQNSVTKFVLASTSSVYGRHNPMPYREDADTDHPLSPYASSKKAAETLCYTYHYLHGIDVTVFRYFTVYGPAGRPDMALFRFVQWTSEARPIMVYGDGQQSRDFTYVDDIARGTIAGIKPLGYEVINLGSDRPVVLMDAIRLIEERLQKKSEIQLSPAHAADVPATWADIGKAERMLGWRPQQTFDAGVTQLVEWYQENREWARGLATD